MNSAIEAKIDAAFQAQRQKIDEQAKAAEEQSNQRAAFDRDFLQLVKEVITPACREFAELVKRKGKKCEVTKGWPTGDPTESWRGNQVNFHLGISDAFPYSKLDSPNFMPRVSFEPDTEAFKVRVARHASSINGSPLIDSKHLYKIQDLDSEKVHEELADFVVQVTR